jgi:predicted kinase
MRKWMRDRLQRRKKQTEKPPAEAAPAPLQPAFYGIEPPAESPQSEEPRGMSEAAPEAPEAAEPEPPAEELQRAQSPAKSTAPRRRRRRGRGGRGSQAPRKVASTTPASAEASSETAEPSQTTPTISPAEPTSSADTGTAAETASATVPRPSRGTVVLAIGLPGSGKSSWFKRHNITPLSSDLLRSLLFDDPTEQRFQDLVFSNLRSMLKARLIARRPMNYVDATNLTSHDRHGWIKLAKDYGYDVQAVFFDVPLEVCLERNQKRERVVGEDVMRRMASKLKPPKFEEGFSKITVVKVKQKEQISD